jgi:hypothetical protein
MVPWTTVPFFSSSVTVSCESFIKKRTSFILQHNIHTHRELEERELEGEKERERESVGESNRLEYVL